MTAVSNQLQDAEALLLRTRGKRVTSYDILPQADQFSINEKIPSEMLEEFGSAYRKYLNCILITQKIRNACALAAEECRAFLRHRNTAEAWASYRLGASFADELSLDLWMKAFEKGTPAFRVYVKSDVKNYNHTFVIYGATQDEFIDLYDHHGNDFFKIMKNLTKGTVIDPYLNSVCPVDEFESSATAAYCREGHITVYEDCMAHPPVDSLEEAQQIYMTLSAETDRVVAAARKLLNARKNDNDAIKELSKIMKGLPHEDSKG